jgi:hypothetical protein
MSYSAQPRTPVEIAGGLTSDDWAETRSSLAVGCDPAQWRDAFDRFLKCRLELRYLKPIQTLRDNDTYSGEGFSISALQCTLIEFLTAINAGMNYRHRGTASPHEYSQSGPLFREFLATQAPFDTHFNAKSANDFYVNIRCGLLHEAATKDGWRIRGTSGNGRVIDPVTKIVFRNDLQDLIERFVEQFRVRIVSDRYLQAAFIRKFDDLSAT